MIALCSIYDRKPLKNRTRYVKVSEIPPPPAPLFVGMASGLVILAGFLFVAYQICKVIP